VGRRARPADTAADAGAAGGAMRKNVSFPSGNELARYERAARRWAEREGIETRQPFSWFAREAMRRMVEQEKLGDDREPQRSS
jgi:hypothetical protein